MSEQTPSPQEKGAMRIYAAVTLVILGSFAAFLLASLLTGCVMNVHTRDNMPAPTPANKPMVLVPADSTK